MEREKKLTNIRLASLFYRLKKERIEFIQDYKFQFLVFNFNLNHVKSKYQYYQMRKGALSKKMREKVVIARNDKTDIFNTTLKYYFETISEDARIEEAYKYLVYKTYSISAKYPNTTLKIRQTLKFIDYITKHSEDQYLKTLGEDYIEYAPKDDSIFMGLTNFDKLIASFPPPFYKVSIYLKSLNGESVTFEKMSSGERQYLFYLSTLLYHLKNLDSVVNDDESVHYKNVNIILEEVELYFHPEYPRQFITKLIKYIEFFHLINHKYFKIFIFNKHSDKKYTKLVFFKLTEKFRYNIATPFTNFLFF